MKQAARARDAHSQSTVRLVKLRVVRADHDMMAQSVDDDDAGTPQIGSAQKHIPAPLATTDGF